MFEIFVEESARKELKKLPKEIAKQIVSNIDKLEKDPKPSNCKKLKGFEDVYRIKVGRYRVVYELNVKKREVIIFRIAHRKHAYQNI